ncbi:alpha/beta fold hydrolase [Mycolicibacterium brisbanense]
MFDHADVRIHYVTVGTPPSAGGQDRTLVLLHGWPQMWWEWRHVMEPLHADGWFVVAPDYRGAGGSSKPDSGYDKHTMAGDTKALLDRLGVKKPITLVAHDPVLGLGGTASFFLPIAESMLSEVAENVTVRSIEDSGHWIAEEQPEGFLLRLREFIAETGGDTKGAAA